jgi:hypothetical protein
VLGVDEHVVQPVVPVDEPRRSGLRDAVAGLQLLAAVEAASSSDVVLADGFSCRTQLADLTGRRAHHLAEILARTLPVED